MRNVSIVTARLKERSDMEAGAPLEPIVDAIARRKKATKGQASSRVIRAADPRNSAQLLCGDLLHVLPDFPDNHFDAVVCDPPYGIDMDRWGRRSPTARNLAPNPPSAEAGSLVSGIWCAPNLPPAGHVHGGGRL